jgi:hypothetical protein
VDQYPACETAHRSRPRPDLTSSPPLVRL